MFFQGPRRVILAAIVFVVCAIACRELFAQGEQNDAVSVICNQFNNMQYCSMFDNETYEAVPEILQMISSYRSLARREKAEYFLAESLYNCMLQRTANSRALNREVVRLKACIESAALSMEEKERARYLLAWCYYRSFEIAGSDDEAVRYLEECRKEVAAIEHSIEGSSPMARGALLLQADACMWIGRYYSGITAEASGLSRPDEALSLVRMALDRLERVRALAALGDTSGVQSLNAGLAMKTAEGRILLSQFMARQGQGEMAVSECDLALKELATIKEGGDFAFLANLILYRLLAINRMSFEQAIERQTDQDAKRLWRARIAAEEALALGDIARIADLSSRHSALGEINLPLARYYRGVLQEIVGRLELVKRGIAYEAPKLLQDYIDSDPPPEQRMFREDAQLRLLEGKLEDPKILKDTIEMQNVRTKLASVEALDQDLLQRKTDLDQLLQVYLGLPLCDNAETVVLGLLQAIVTSESSTGIPVVFLERLESILGGAFSNMRCLRPDALAFYGGVAAYLRGNIAPESEMTSWKNAVRMLGTIQRGDYYDEARYLMALCKIDMETVRTKGSAARPNHAEAVAILEDLVKRVGHVRALYWLVGILPAEQKSTADDYCRMVLQVLGKSREEGKEYFEKGASKKCTSLGEDENIMVGDKSMRGADFRYPGGFEFRGRRVYVEQLVESEAARQLRIEQTLRRMQLYVGEVPTVYVSINRFDGSGVLRSALEGVDCGVDERISSFLTRLEMKIVCEGSAKAYFDNEPLEAVIPGQVFRRDSIALFSRHVIRIEADCYLPKVVEHRFDDTPVEEDLREVVLTSWASWQYDLVPPTRLCQLPGGNQVFVPEWVKSTEGLIESATRRNVRDCLFLESGEEAYVVNAAQGSIDRVNLMSGKRLPFISGGFNADDRLVSPEGIAADEEGQLYVSDCERHRIVVFDSKGQYQRQFGQLGHNDSGTVSTPVRFTFPTRLCIYKVDGSSGSSGLGPSYLLVADWNGLHLIDSNGLYLGTVLPPEAFGETRGVISDLAVVETSGGFRLVLARPGAGELQAYKPTKCK